MKKFTISMLVIFGFILVFTISGIVAFNSFPKNEKNDNQNVQVNSPFLSNTQSYESINDNNEALSVEGVLTIITPSTDKAKTVVRYGTRDDIIIYEKVSYANDGIDVGEVVDQNNIAYNDTPKTQSQTEKNDTSSSKKEDNKTTSESDKKNEDKKDENSEDAVEDDEKAPAEADGEKDEAKAESKGEEQSLDTPVAEEPKVEEQPPKEPGLDPDKYYSDTGL
ncbi:MAG: hypothetical protein ACI3XA_01265 [Clostridia bacterium]